jgi:hypothetical protein
MGSARVPSVFESQDVVEQALRDAPFLLQFNQIAEEGLFLAWRLRTTREQIMEGLLDSLERFHDDVRMRQVLST